MATIRPPASFPTGVIRSGAAKPRAIDNNSTWIAEHVKQAELACQHLAAGRRVATGGTCGPTAITGTSKVWKLKLPLEPYTKFARVKGYITGDETDVEITVIVTSDTDATGFTVVVFGAGVNRSEAQYWDGLIQVGVGDKNDLGGDGIEVDIQITAGAIKTGKVWFVGAQPMPQHEPFTATISVG